MGPRKRGRSLPAPAGLPAAGGDLSSLLARHGHAHPGVHRDSVRELPYLAALNAPKQTLSRALPDKIEKKPRKAG
jgi:hypothetical protein